MSPDHAVLLRILSGPNAGAEMELAPGEWVLGSGDESHLLITDPGVTARHLAVRVGEDGSARLTPLEGDVVLDGGPLAAGGAELPAFAVFSAGGFSACIGPAGEAWPSPALPGARPAAPPADAALSAPAEAPLPSDPPADPPADDGDANTVGGDKVGGKRAVRLATRVALACLLLVLALYGGFCPADDKKAEDLTRLLHEAGYGQTYAVETADKAGVGGLLVQGVVPGNAALDELGLYVERMAPGATVDVLSVESVAQALQAAVRRADAALRVSRAGTGLRVAGYVYDAPTLEALFAEQRDMLKRVPATMDVVTWKELAPRLTRLVQARNLRGRLRVLPGAYRISVQAQALSPQQEENLNAVLREAEMEVRDTQPFVRELWEQPTRVRLPSAVKTDPAPSSPPAAPADPAPSSPPAAPADPAPSSPPAAPADPAADAAPENRPDTPPDEGSGTGESETPAEPPSLLFSALASGGLRCEQVEVEGSGASMAVVYEGNRYGVGAKLPNGYQVGNLTPRYVVFHFGRRYTQICPARPAR